MIYLGIILIGIYGFAMVFYAFQFKKSLDRKNINTTPKTSFSIIIPFRNEAEHMNSLLQHLKHLDYPRHLFEVLLVNDHSEDSSVEICQDFIKIFKLNNFKIYQNQNLAKSPKKSAVLSALPYAKFDYILNTDADCVVPESWLKAYNQKLYQKSFDFIAAPVYIQNRKGIWNNYQTLDLMCLQVIGLGSFAPKHYLMCNAANMCLKKEALQRLNAIEQHKHIVSGDDVFTLEQFRLAKQNIATLVHQEAVVKTLPESNFYTLSQQRLRWASKSKHYKNPYLISLGILVLFTNLYLVIITPFIIVIPKLFWLFWLVKMAIDSYVLFIGYNFFKENIKPSTYLLTLFIYPFATTYFGLKSLGGKFSWKGRAYKV